jgi:hypothetical protein
MPRPLVGHRKLHLSRRILPLQFQQLRPHALERRLGGEPLTRGAGAHEQGFDLAELFAQLRWGRHGLPGRWGSIPNGTSRRVNPGARLPTRFSVLEHAGGRRPLFDAELALPRHALMRLGHVLDAIFEFAIPLGQLFDHFEGAETALT